MTAITTISPVSSKPIIKTQGVSLEKLDADILPVAISSQKQWAKTALQDRKKIVEKFIELFTSDEISTKLAYEISEQMGRPIRYAKGEISTAALRASHLLKFADEALSPISVDQDTPKFKKFLTREPHGVVLIIFPWNYPYLCLINGLIPSLLAGNSVLIKPSPQTPKVADAIVELFQQAGLPSGVVQAVHCGDPKVIEGLLSRKAISAVVFTGSVIGGLAVQKACANRTIPVALELGGNDAAYVRADVADIKATAEDIVDGSIFNSGQSCCAIERVYVRDTVYDKFVEEVVKCVKSYKLGDPFDESTQLGPVISERAARTIKAQIKDAVDRGAKKLIPDDVFSQAEKLNPTFVGPQVLVDLDETSRKYIHVSIILYYIIIITGLITQKHDYANTLFIFVVVVVEETFGPVIPIIKVKSDEEAIEKINDSDYGLTASVWTSDLARGEEIGDEIEAGTVFVNRSDYPDPNLAWTGFKNSGRGVSLSKFGFDFFTKLKSHHIKDLS